MIQRFMMVSDKWLDEDEMKLVKKTNADRSPENTYARSAGLFLVIYIREVYQSK